MSTQLKLPEGYPLALSEAPLTAPTHSSFCLHTHNATGTSNQDEPDKPEPAPLLSITTFVNLDQSNSDDNISNNGFLTKGESTQKAVRYQQQ
ncbi:hypothetical protein PAXRUDRAFT_15386 [Paxillus rubicundulus Ve08.2h10]|uniref:Uncharacterized protein n=1 Tax=Paxillus rubicundulus Ve08.2h10 TaxID=930991 RepID=A0A0D0DPY0_9AGAM|nr:hypothetical protein PAXRUDRAFT_15386 [Paxillus rubicundulus Ve08.2h10]